VLIVVQWFIQWTLRWWNTGSANYSTGLSDGEIPVQPITPLLHKSPTLYSAVVAWDIQIRWMDASTKCLCLPSPPMTVPFG